MEGLKSITSKICNRRSFNDKLVQAEWEGKIPKPILKKHFLPLDNFPTQRIVVRDLYQNYINSKTYGAFFQYNQRMARALIHPSLANDKKAQYNTNWNNESCYLNYFATDVNFINSMKDGTVIFVDQYANGEAIQKCLMETHGIDKIDFLTGKTSAEERARMVKEFEKPLDGKPRVMLLMIEAGGTGINLKNNGKTAIIATKKFNPKSEAQAICRILRAGSSKGDIQIIDLNSKTNCERHIRYLQKRKLYLEKCLFTEKNMVNSGQNNNNNNNSQDAYDHIEAFKTLVKTVFMHVKHPIYRENKQKLNAWIEKFVDIAQNDESLSKDIRDQDPLQKPAILVVDDSPQKTDNHKRPRDLLSSEKVEDSNKKMRESSIGSLDEVRTFLKESRLEEDCMNLSYFKVNDPYSPLHSSLSSLLGKKSFAHIIPLQASKNSQHSNWQTALGALEKLEQMSPNEIQEQMNRIRRHRDISMQARLKADELKKSQSTLHKWLWEILQKPLENSNDTNVAKRFAESGHEVVILDMKTQKLEKMFGLTNPKKVSYLARFNDGHRKHYDILYPAN